MNSSKRRKRDDVDGRFQGHLVCFEAAAGVSICHRRGDAVPVAIGASLHP